MREAKRKLTGWKRKEYPNRPTLKVEMLQGMNVIRCRKEDLDWEKGKSLSICIPDFRGQKNDPIRSVIHIEWFDGKLSVRMYNGGEDPIIGYSTLNPDPVLDMALNCPKTDLPKLIGTDDPDVIEIIEQRLKGD